MNEAIRQRARELGFDDCRFTTAAPPHSAPRFDQWLAEGRHGEMLYLQRNAPKRIDPNQVLPGVRSVVTLAATYATEGDTSRPGLGGQGQLAERLVSASGPKGVDVSSSDPATAGSRSGIVARYARSEDYHTVLGERLKQLAEFLDHLGGEGSRSLWYVDTGPILERDLAQRSGLGFIGKHTNLVSRRLGNWILLSEILTTLELPPDAPEQNRCGRCVRCLDACPTRAITAPFQLDARRCISYLTIELKGSIPIELRSAIGNRIYGCDDCLAACPWNRFAREGQLMKPHARPDLATPDLVDLLGLDEPGFRSRFAGTPMLRAKRQGLLRNVCVALGNVGEPEALPALSRAAADPEPLVAEHARWAIGQIKARQHDPNSMTVSSRKLPAAAKMKSDL